MLFEYIVELTRQGYAIRFTHDHRTLYMIVDIRKDGFTYKYMVSYLEFKNMPEEALDKRVRDLLEFMVENTEEKIKKSIEEMRTKAGVLISDEFISE